MNKKLSSIYLAGKIQLVDHNYPDWRESIVDQQAFDSWGYSSGREVHDHSWPICEKAIFGEYDYTGPFFIDCGHGCFTGDDEHGVGARSGGEYETNHEGLKGIREATLQRSLHAIAESDLIFAWIDSIDCYGTIAEIGYAKALNKLIWIGGPRRFRDLWFVYQMAEKFACGPGFGHNGSPEGILLNLLRDYRRLHPQFDSPIEQAFWNEWTLISCSQMDFPLIPQYQIGKYRVDFAHIESKTAIELDGHATHSSPDAIAYDRKRQREIESQGWHVIRFGGKEIYRSASTCAMEVHAFLTKREHPSLTEVFPPDYEYIPEPTVEQKVVENFIAHMKGKNS